MAYAIAMSLSKLASSPCKNREVLKSRCRVVDLGSLLSELSAANICWSLAMTTYTVHLEVLMSTGYLQSVLHRCECC